MSKVLGIKLEIMTEATEEITPRKVVNRDLTAKERKLATWMLNHGSKEATSFLRDLEAALVIEECSCGCGSIDFAINGIEPEGVGLGVLGDYMFGDAGSKDECNVFIFERGGSLAGIEFVWMYDEATIRIPEPEELVTF